MKVYELAYIISSDITSEEAEAKAKKIESEIQSKEGIIVKQLNPVAKTLAFPIGKKASGFFGVIEFQLEPEKIIELEDIIRKDGKIVRHMVIIKEPLRIRKERRGKRKPVEIFVANQKAEVEETKEPKIDQTEGFGAVKEREKVELKDIEQQLDEILG